MSGPFAHHEYPPSGSFQISATAYLDSEETEFYQATPLQVDAGVDSTDDSAIVINNVADQERSVGCILDLSEVLSFADPQYGKTYSYTINWGDGSGELTDYSLNPNNVISGAMGVPAIGTIDQSHTYSQPGTYSVTVSVSDLGDATRTDTEVFQVIVTDDGPSVTACGTNNGVYDSPISIPHLVRQAS